MNKIEKKVTDRFNKAIFDYGLIDDDDKILIGLSGGKDSLCLLDLLSKRAKIFKPHFEIEAIHVRMENIAYESDSTYLMDFAESRGVKLHIVTTSFDSSTDTRKSPCFLCSWTRRKKIFELAKELKCNKIALGHHQDDIIHTSMMNEFFQGRYETMQVKKKLDKMPITIIRPLCLEHEIDIKHYTEFMEFEKQKKQCPYEKDSHRTDIRKLFEDIEKINSEARNSVWHALERENKLF